MDKLNQHAQLVQERLSELGFTNKVTQLPDSTRTAQEAADTIGCSVSQIAKSIIFRLKNSDEALLVIASGVNRVNESQMQKYVDDELGKADADFVRKHTGYVIGGVPPLGHKYPMTTFIDEDLFHYDDIWAAAGHPKAVFQLTPDELVGMTKGEVVQIT